MRATHHGRPGTAVIPEDWAERHRPTAEATLSDAALCEIRKPDTVGEFDRDTGTRPGTPGLLMYAGRCRIVRGGQQRQPVAEQTLNLADYLVVVPFDANAVEPDCIVTVTQTDDPDLLDRRLYVTGVALGSHLWERDLYCTAGLTPVHE